MPESTVYFHGGIPGLVPGDLLLSPEESGTKNTLSTYARGLAAPNGTRRDVVYLSERQDTARAFAAFYPDGALYQAEPLGPIEPDPDAPTAAVMVPRAVVVAVIRPRIVFAHRTPESWFRLLLGPRKTGARRG